MENLLDIAGGGAIPTITPHLLICLLIELFKI